MKVYLEVENLLDLKIPRRINPFTGEGFDPGVIYSYSLLDSPNPNYDPSRIRPPRSSTMGIQVLF